MFYNVCSLAGYKHVLKYMYYMVHRQFLNQTHARFLENRFQKVYICVEIQNVPLRTVFANPVTYTVYASQM